MSVPADRFSELVRRLGATRDPRAVADALLSAYGEPGRVYHGVAHLRDCLARLDEAAEPGDERDRVEAALWFHDAVYDPRAHDNEERSAEWARRALVDLGVPHDHRG